MKKAKKKKKEKKKRSICVCLHPNESVLYGTKTRGLMENNSKTDSIRRKLSDSLPWIMQIAMQHCLASNW